MGKKIQERKPRQKIELTEEQKTEIERKRKEIMDIKYRGSVKNVYPKLRKGTVTIFKSDNTEEEKKQDLITLMEDCINELKGVSNE